MKYVLTGVETNNKGAELMLYAILQEIARVDSNAIVYIGRNQVKQGLEYIQTDVELHYLPENIIYRVLKKIKFVGILNRLGIYGNFLNNVCPIDHVDYLIDGSGLAFSDKMIKDKRTALGWECRLSIFKKQGAKIIFLPQAFGPLENSNTLRTIKVLFTYSDLICAREHISYNYLKNVSGFIDSKVAMFTDFTSAVEGVVPKQYNHLKNAVCIIPNIQMVRKGAISMDAYLEYIELMVNTCKKAGHSVYILNHEGKRDDVLLEIIKNKIPKIECVSGLNALEVKGLISTAYLVITSRFHGLASALNTAVPSLATSWSHKYKCLFEDYKQSDCVLSLTDTDIDMKKILSFLEPSTNHRIRQELKTIKPSIEIQTKEMWKMIWNI